MLYNRSPICYRSLSRVAHIGCKPQKAPIIMLKQRAIFFFWLPLAFSWLLMTFEGPWVQAVISRKPDAELQLAAFGLVMSLSVTIEAPVIMMLAVGSALAHNKHAYKVLWRYMMVVNVLITIVAALMAFTPLLDWYLGGLLGIPPHIIDAVRPGMVIMILWSALIGYRRFHQGILINQNRTRTVGTGAIIRIAASAGVAFALGAFSDLPGAVIGAWALIMAVTVEAIYVHLIVQPDVAKLKQKDRPARRPPLTYGGVLRFHLPLALTSLLTLLVRPVIESGLASAPDAERALAAWPVVFAIILVMRSGGLAWQEVVITLSKGPSELQALRRFTWVLGFGTSGLMMVLAFTPLIDIYSNTILGVPATIQPLIVTGTAFGILLPLFTVLQSYLRALLMLTDTTAPIYQGMFIGFMLTAALMWLGLQLNVGGIVMASLALTGGTLVELLYLLVAFRRHEDKLQITWAAAAAD